MYNFICHWKNQKITECEGCCCYYCLVNISILDNTGMYHMCSALHATHQFIMASEKPCVMISKLITKCAKLIVNIIATTAHPPSCAILLFWWDIFEEL